MNSGSPSFEPSKPEKGETPNLNPKDADKDTGDSLTLPRIPAFESFLHSYTVALAEMQLATPLTARTMDVKQRAFELREEPPSLHGVSVTQKRSRRELIAAFSSYAREADPQSAEAIVGAIAFTHFRTVAAPGSEPRESVIAEIRNPDGKPLLLLDAKLQLVGGGLPIATLVREVDAKSEAPFEFSLLPSLEYFAGEINALKGNFPRPLEEFRTPLLVHYLRRDIAAALYAIRQAEWGTNASIGIVSERPERVDPQFIEIMHIEKVARWFDEKTGDPLFLLLESSHGRFSWMATWSESTGKVESSATIIRGS